MNVEIGAQTDVGRARDLNEDGYIVEEPLFAVADGMGGHRAGEVASRMALEALAERPPDDEAHTLAERVRAANRVVHQRAAEDRELEGMGTTVTALWMDGDEARIAHVGDSRAYLLRDGELRLLTEDHTLVQRMVSEGKLTPEEAEVHPQRSILTRALGVDEEVDVDDFAVEVTSGDRIVLCTDGLTSMIGEDRIAELLRGNDRPQDAADALVDAANEAGGQDNITVVVLDFDGGGAGGRGRAAAATEAVRPAPEEVTRREPADLPPEEIAPGAEDTDVISVPPRATPSQEWRGSDDAGRPRRWLRWVGAAVVILVALAVGGKVYVDRQWFVGVSGDRVAVFRGVPSELLGLDLSTLVRATELPSAEAQRLSSWSELDEGIAVANEEEANAVVEQIRRDLAARGGGAEPPPSPGGPSPEAS